MDAGRPHWAVAQWPSGEVGSGLAQLWWWWPTGAVLRPGPSWAFKGGQTRTALILGCRDWGIHWTCPLGHDGFLWILGRRSASAHPGWFHSDDTKGTGSPTRHGAAVVIAPGMPGWRSSGRDGQTARKRHPPAELRAEYLPEPPRPARFRRTHADAIPALILRAGDRRARSIYRSPQRMCPLNTDTVVFRSCSPGMAARETRC